MKPRTALWVSLSGTIIVAICCFTSALIVIVSAVELSAWIGYLDSVLLPGLGIFFGLTLWSYWRYHRHCHA